MDKLLRRSHRKSKGKAEKAGKGDADKSDSQQVTPTKHKKDKRKGKEQENVAQRPKIQHLGPVGKNRPLEELQQESQKPPQQDLQQEPKVHPSQLQHGQQQVMTQSFPPSTPHHIADAKKPVSGDGSDVGAPQPGYFRGTQPTDKKHTQSTAEEGITQPSITVRTPQPADSGGTLPNNLKQTPASNAVTESPQSTNVDKLQPSSAEKNEILKTTDLNRRHTIGASHLAQKIFETELSIDTFQKPKQRKGSMDDADVRSLPGGDFLRNSPYRASLPVVRPIVNMSKARPLGLVYLQFSNETRRAWMPNEITGLDTVRALFVRAFPKLLTMPIIEQTRRRVYIRNPVSEIFYELQNLREVKDRSVLRLVEGVPSSVIEPPMSPVTSTPNRNYYSEPEFDVSARDMRQHRHVTTTIHRYQQQQQQKQQKQAPAPPPRSSAVYTTNTERTVPDEHDSQTLPTRPVRPSPSSGFRSVSVSSSRSSTLPASAYRDDRSRQATPTNHIYAVPVRHVSASSVSGMRPTSAPPSSSKPRPYDTPKKKKVPTATLR